MAAKADAKTNRITRKALLRKQGSCSTSKMRIEMLDNIRMEIPKGKKLFFLSDFHLGSPDHASSRERENRIVAWLDRHEAEMAGLFLLGDIFDYWFEYRHVVPKGFVRLFGKLAAIGDLGIPIHFFCGNHDTWIRDYFEKEIGITPHKGNALLRTGNRLFFIGHGDGLGPGEKGYKFMKAIFNARICKLLYSALHPCWGYRIAIRASRNSRKKAINRQEQSIQQREKGKNRNLLFFMQEYLQHQHVDAFIFGHRHWPLIAKLSLDKAIMEQETLPELHTEWHDHEVYYLNTGDWLRHDSYASFDGTRLCLEGKNIRTEFI